MSNHPTKTCTAVPPQLCAMLINMREDSLPPVTRPPEGYLYSPYCGRLSLKYSSTQTTQRSVNSSNMPHPPQPQTPTANTYGDKSFTTTLLPLKTRSRGQGDCNLCSAQLFTRCYCLRRHIELLIEHATYSKGKRHIFCDKYRQNIRPGTSAKTNIETPTPVVHRAGIKHHASDVNAIKDYQNWANVDPARSNGTVHHRLHHSPPEKGEVRALYVQDWDLLSGKECIEIPWSICNWDINGHPTRQTPDNCAWVHTRAGEGLVLSSNIIYSRTGQVDDSLL